MRSSFHAARSSVSDNHDAATIDIPAADRFALITKRGAGAMIWDRSYWGVECSEKAVFVTITLSAGRDDEKKRALYARIAANLAANAVRPEDVLIALTENTRVDWSFGSGIAHYVPGPDAAG